MNVDLTLAAHTNVGKTSLMRTLLRRDIGEVADRPHVTENAERHTLIDTPAGDVLHLWDTPGFGDSARLLRRLRLAGNPLGWLQTQVWDRFVDRPFFCSQQAIRAVRDSSDLVLYLVNAGEDPAATAYVEAELQILQWIGKPVLLLLNQTGRPRDRDAALAEENQWQRRLSAYVPRGAVATLDAFARCWVQEDRLLALAGGLLPEEKRAAFEALRGAWRERNLAAFRDAVGVIAASLAQTAADREPLPESDLRDTLTAAARRIVGKDKPGEIDPATRQALDAVTKRLRERERTAADRLIALHGLAGNSRERIIADLSNAVQVSRPVSVAASGALGGFLGGAVTGLAADLASGGLTLGLGALIGGLVGVYGGGMIARDMNESMGLQEGRLRWSSTLLAERVKGALLLYLAVAHFGRARGAWIDEEAPAHWAQLIEDVVAKRSAAYEEIWAAAAETDAEALTRRLEPEIDAAARELLSRLYPEAWEMLHGTR